GADDAGGQQAELEGAVADDQRVAGVVAALEADDDVGPLRQPVDDLALALVAPLGADHRDIGHRYSSIPSMPPARKQWLQPWRLAPPPGARPGPRPATVPPPSARPRAPPASATPWGRNRRGEAPGGGKAASRLSR